MPAQNVIANLFTSIQNAELRNQKECLVTPASRLASEVLRVMQRAGYIGEFEFIDDGRSGKLRVQLLGRINKCGAITPRFPVRRNEFTRWEQQFLPAAGVGVLAASTSKGVMTHQEAMQKGLGGVLLGYVY